MPEALSSRPRPGCDSLSCVPYLAVVRHQSWRFCVPRMRDFRASLLRGDLALGLALFLAQTFELRLQAAAQPAIDAVEVEIDHRGDVEREQLGEAQPADHRDAERLAQLRTLAGPERDRQRA